MELNLFVVCFLVLALIGYLLIRKKYDYWLKRGVPYIRPAFPLGNLQEIGSTKHMATFLEESYNDLKGKDIFGGVFCFTKPVIVPIDLNLISNILIKDVRYFQNNENTLCGHSLSLNEQYKNEFRNKLNYMMTSDSLKMMFPTISMTSQNLSKYLGTLSRKDQIDMTSIVSRFAMDVVAFSTFGMQLNSLKDATTEVFHIAEKTLNSQESVLRCWFIQMFPKLARKLRIKLKTDVTSKPLVEYLSNVIKSKQKNRTSKNDFLSLLLQSKNARKNVTNQNVIEQAVVLFNVSFQITLSIMTFALYELAFNQDIQDKVRREIRKILRDQKEFNYEQCEEIPYLDRILKETLRKYPVVSFLQRQLSHDYPVRDCRHMMKKGLWLLIPIYAIHRDPDIYPNPEKFDPDRFTEGNIKKRHPCAWLPFGEGSLNCAGQSLAMLQVRVGLATLLNKYRILPCSKTPTPMIYAPNQHILASDSKIWLRVSKI